ncbi:MAG: hypothetical protein CM15mP12_8220 [Gammaproteobacteria bacterium]|nr:MAG: hypothetical protein CM15mP12_8220 [Gammaproteobacteria bacterium]
MDGAVSTNNPALIAFTEAKNFFQEMKLKFLALGQASITTSLMGQERKIGDLCLA